MADASFAAFRPGGKVFHPVFHRHAPRRQGFQGSRSTRALDAPVKPGHDGKGMSRPAAAASSNGNDIMAIDTTTVLKIARLARIAVKPEDCAHLAQEINGILAWVEQLNEVDTTDIEPMKSVVAMELPRRKDEVTDGNIRDAILANAPEAEAGFFVVPKVVE
jgi:aspartyl-tRNA(Asn)/glutamyl-tRNA(Gln) amidotransferase subunit C